MATCGRKAAVLRRRDVLVFAVAVKRDTRAVDAALRSAAVAAKLEPRPRIGMVCTPLRGKWQTRRVRL
jgi:predicted outer membrane protein